MLKRNRIDYVPPPPSWAIVTADRGVYSHLNLGIVSLELTVMAHGVLGYTKSVQYDTEGNPIMSATGSNGDGLLEGKADDYVVSGLFESDFTYSVFQDPSARPDRTRETSIN